MQEIIDSLRKFAKLTSDISGSDVDGYKEDLAFAGGHQVLSKDQNILGDGRNKMVFNITRQYCNQTTNAYRRDPFKPSFMPRTSDASELVSHIDGVFQGWLDKSAFLPASCMGVDRQVKAGVGYALMYNDYVDDGFDQDIHIKALPRVDLVIFDSMAKDPSGEDQTKGAIIEHISQSEAKNRYGDICDWERVESPLENTKWQAPEESVELVKFFVLEKSTKRIYQNEAGESLDYTDEMESEGFKPPKQRKVAKKTVKCYTICGDQVIESTELSLSRIPIIRFYGELVDDITGHQHPVGMVHFAKDAQRLVNWLGSVTGERIMLVPKPSRYVDMRSISNYKGIWAKANKAPAPYLPFDSVDEHGNQLLAPQDTNPSANISDSTSAQANFQGLLSSIMGMPEQGMSTSKGFQQTATEVLTKNKSSEVANFQFIDNAKEAVKAIGKMWLEFALIVYDTARLLPIKDGENMQMGTVNFAELGIKASDLNISVDAGPMQATQMQETMNSLLALGSMLGPEATLVFSDDIVKATSFKGSQEIADKLSALSKMKTGIGGDKDAQQDPEAMQALQKADEVIQMKDSQIAQMQAYISQMQVESQVAETEAKAKIITQQMGDATKVYLKELDINAGNMQLLANIEADYQADLRKSQMEFSKLYAELQKTSAPSNQPPRMTAINGQRNELYGY